MSIVPLLFLLLLAGFLIPHAVFSAETEDSARFFEGHDWMEKHQPQKAIPIFEEALQKYPDSKVRDLTLFWLGRAYAETGQVEKGRGMSAALEKSFPESPLRPKLAKVLASKEAALARAEKKEKEKEKERERREAKAAASKAIASKKEPPVVAKGEPSEERIPSSRSAAPRQAEGFMLVIPQVADLKIEPAADEKRGYPGEEVEFPIVIANRGNGEDSFTLDSTFPIEYRPTFYAEEGTREPIQTTPALQPDQSFRARLKVHLPPNMTDNQNKTFEIKVASRFDRNSFQWIRKTVVASAPLLLGEYHTDKEHARPGEEVRYTITLLNNGGAEARDVRVRYAYHPALVFLSASPAPERVESAGRAIYWNLSGIKSKGNEKIEVAFKVGDETAAGQQILNRGVYIASVGGEVPFLSPPTSVRQVASLRLEGAKEEQRVVSGDQIFFPFTLTNLGNGPDQFTLKAAGVPSDRLTLYFDKNQDGLYQSGEPEIGETPPLGTRENVSILVGVKVPAGRDGERLDVRLEAQSKQDAKATVTASRALLLSLPMVVVQTQMQSRDSIPGGVISYQATVTNTGSGLARNVVISEVVPPELEFVHADPEPTEKDGKRWVWKMNELGPQQKRTFAVSVRIRKGLSAGTVVQKQTETQYQDLHGNRYP
ncbi:MAG: DUF11 domain-containing protein [Nitrospirae bacterium]|nr:DUF11 domain-containing protein [Candidatus Manganitrophaceae bacterium]